MTPQQPIKTRIIVWREGVGYWWRAPIKVGRTASVELRSMYDYGTEVSARAAAVRHVKRLFAEVEFE